MSDIPPSDAELRQAASEMADELESQKLEVCKIPTDSGYVRVVVCPSPDWYSRLCRKYEFPRRKRYKKHRTIIKRVDTLRILRRIAAGTAKPGAYVSRLMPYIEQQALDRRD